MTQQINCHWYPLSQWRQNRRPMVSYQWRSRQIFITLGLLIPLLLIQCNSICYMIVPKCPLYRIQYTQCAQQQVSLSITKSDVFKYCKCSRYWREVTKSPSVAETMSAPFWLEDSTAVSSLSGLQMSAPSVTPRRHHVRAADVKQLTLLPHLVHLTHHTSAIKLLFIPLFLDSV